MTNWTITADIKKTHDTYGTLYFVLPAFKLLDIDTIDEALGEALKIIGNRSGQVTAIGDGPTLQLKTVKIVDGKIVDRKVA